MPLVRVNQQTGKTEYWNVTGGGWVEIREINAISEEEFKAKEEALNEWYELCSLNFKSKISKDDFFILYRDTPFWQIEKFFSWYKKNPKVWEDDFLSSSNLIDRSIEEEK